MFSGRPISRKSVTVLSMNSDCPSNITALSRSSGKARGAAGLGLGLGLRSGAGYFPFKRASQVHMNLPSH